MKLIPILFLLGVASARKASDDAKLNPAEQKSFEEFKKAALAMDIKNPLMKKDCYLNKFFKDVHHDVAAAKTKFSAALAFRKDHKIDDLQNDSFDDIAKLIPADVSQTDKENQPILFVPGSDYDIPSMIAEGKGKRLRDYYYKYWEKMANMAIEAKEKHPEVSRYVYIMDADRQNIRNTGAETIQFSTELAQNFDTKWPRMMDKFIFINMPPFSVLVLNTVKAFFSQDSKDNMHVLGTDPAEIKALMLQIYKSEGDIPKNLWMGGARDSLSAIKLAK